MRIIQVIVYKIYIHNIYLYNKTYDESCNYQYVYLYLNI